MLSYKLFENKINKPKIGDLVICEGNIDGLKTHNHIGILREKGIQFINRFSQKLHDLSGTINNNNGWYIDSVEWVRSFDKNNINNNIPLLFSEKFKEILSYSLKYLLDYEKIYFSDISYIDISKNDIISFLSANNYHKLDPKEDPWLSTMRQSMRIGRFLKKITNDPDALIEDSVNEYKFSFKIYKNDLGRFKIAKGMEMSKWYLEMNYAEGGGTLKGSCMRHVRSQKKLPIYTNNPNKVRMLYLLNPIGKLLGRALIWRLDEPKGVIYMDRIYYIEDYIENLFLNYAKKKNMLTKTEVDNKNITLKVYIDKDYGPPINNPFMDTFKYFIKKDNYLTNRFKNFKHGEYWEYINYD